MKHTTGYAAAFLALFLSGCGGGGGGSGSSVSKTDLPLLSTGQTVVYADYDDGYYGLGKARSYSRDDSAETVTDNVTGLMWEDGSSVVTQTRDWSAQKSYCGGLKQGGYSDWRMPTIEELRTIVDYSVPNIPFDSSAFFQTSSGYLWSATEVTGLDGYAWALHANSGRHGYYAKTGSYYVRCVRTAFSVESEEGGGE